ncbi:MAG: ABC transporter ATP-binding protein [Candidatus Firestonebacteria bacterium]|nr:ABC transporter ATP-binding protein [Candidatus Firestonebacteria bacterium]
MAAVIQANKLNKSFRFGKIKAVTNLDLEVKEGEVYGFLGRNGSGKTTTINLLMGLLRQNSGEAYLLGCSSKELSKAVLEQIGFVSEGINMPNIKVGKLIKTIAGFYPTWDDKYATELLSEFKLPENMKVKALSRGMNLKLKLLLALSYRPKLLILDEPFSGIDAVAKQDFMDNMVETLNRTKTTMLFSSHEIEDVERLADRIGIIENGTIALNSSVESLKSSFRRIKCVINEDIKVIPVTEVISVKKASGITEFIVSRNPDEAIAGLVAAGAKDIEPAGMDLREIFIAYERYLECKNTAPLKSNNGEKI